MRSEIITICSCDGHPLDQLREDLARVPAVSPEEAKKMVRWLQRDLEKAEKKARKS